MTDVITLQFYLNELKSLSEIELEEWFRQLTYGDRKGVQKNYLPGVGTLEYVDGDRGQIDGVREIWFIFRIENEEPLYRIQGYYNSWDGPSWDLDVELVEAYQKTITDYRPI